MSSNPHRLKVVVPLAKSPPVSSSFVPFLLLLVPLVPRGRTTSVYLATKAPGSSPRYTFCIKISTEAPTSARLATLPLATRHHSSHRASRHHSFRHHSSRFLVRCGVQRCSAVLDYIFSGVQRCSAPRLSVSLGTPQRPPTTPPRLPQTRRAPPRPSETCAPSAVLLAPPETVPPVDTYRLVFLLRPRGLRTHEHVFRVFLLLL